MILGLVELHMTTKKRQNSISVDMLGQLLEVDFEKGTLFWKARSHPPGKEGRAIASWNAKYAGKPALNCATYGYALGTIHGIKFMAHRVIYAMHSGKWPEASIDHINGNSLDNRIINLRSVSQAENCRNAKLHARNTSGANGVANRRGKWIARINVDGILRQLGTYDTFEEAYAARKAAETIIGYHPNHGKVRKK